MNPKKIFTVGAFALNALLLQAQTYVVQVKSFATEKWGYSNVEGDLIIPAQYEKCYPFSSNGLAVIYDDKQRQYHFIDLKNTRLETDPAKFKIKDGFGFHVSGFHNQLFLVEVNEKWGYMNDEGKMSIPAVYDDGSDFNGGFAVAKKGTNFFILDVKGNETPISTQAMDVRDFSEGLAPIRTMDKKFGFINTKGELAIPSQFESVGYFTNGLAWAKTFDKKVGYIDKTGQWVIKPEFEAAKEFDALSGMARVKKGEKWCYISEDGKVLEVSDTEAWGDFSEGLADGKKGALRGFYDNEGNWVIEPQFQAVREFHNGYAAAKKNEKWGLIDKSGKWVLEPEYDAIKDVMLVK
ncbi:MAG: hypothetical protein K0S23_416 [Fluviicola sp.]|uniref:WG repeat-containing protein n=1 Tax=Fluviicola sp. TaxID=1917219 RepID=UPI0026263EC0|nr:WG repeat-containing protein [Fluviicola sp.]MDF3026109.1 hypothetical protein [Fluviicola sp.]